MEKPKDIWTILRKHYPENEYALMEEVRDKAGFYASRSADFIAVNLWPSRGLDIHGLELKSHRSDWLTELKKPEKAENIFQYCDYFWLLTTDDTVAKLEEIPSTWGWKYVKGEKILIKKEAPKLTPKTISRHFLCAMLKRATDRSNFIHHSDIEDRITDAHQRGMDTAKRTNDVLSSDLKKLNDAIKDFEQASGVPVHPRDSWRTPPKKMGEIVKFIENGGIESLRKDLLRLEPTTKTILDRIECGLKILKEESNLPS